MRDYQPFAYPPDFQLARIHQQASMPGKVLPNNQTYCPCCQLPIRHEFQNWARRSIEMDFHKFGGSVVTYFWLIKLYTFVSALVLAIYSIYLVICIHQFCSFEEKCEKLIIFWIVSNENLYQIMLEHDHRDIMIRLFTLRGMIYVILLIGNATSLYLVARFKRRYPPPKSIAAFALIFKNIAKSPQDLTLELKQKYPDLEIKQLFAIRKLQPFYSSYYQKLTLYYDCMNEESEKKKVKLMNKLANIDTFCTKQQENYFKTGDRIILVVNEEQSRNQILKYYQISSFNKIKHVLGLGESKKYCEPCPIPQEIIWNHIGQEEKQKIKVKILSVFYFFLLLLGSYGLLFFCMKIVYREIFPQPWNFVIANIILIILVIIALTFRYLMNQLSQMRHPNTQTSRTMFIVLTTVLFHFVYYIIIPTIYFWLALDFQKNKTLLIITNQTINFLIVQFVLAAVDLMYCCWSKRQKKVQNEDKPIGCQKILHKQIQYHRFPIQFKLIILFKIFSFIIFFAFQVPLIMFITFLLLIYLYFKDKHSVYYHYRMEIIDNQVQFKFLKIYSNFFSIYMFVIFILTQHLEVQFWIAFGLMILAIVIQTFFINERKVVDETVLPQSLDELGFTDSYRQRYNKFMEDVICDRLDLQIKQYLAKNGYGSIETEQSGRQNLL